MICLLAEKHSKPIASLLLFVFVSGYTPSFASFFGGNKLAPPIKYGANPVGRLTHKDHSILSGQRSFRQPMEKMKSPYDKPITKVGAEKQPHIGGPNQPEMSSFKSVGTNNMVNLFTGDFSYNIPLMDVGGYPVNIFYDGGVTMEQEASWVGLGWNINPGTISRNMRGVPDDFNGSEVLQQRQEIKPNKTWGVRLGADIEVIGIKSFKAFSGSLGGFWGVSVNNYLGPALDLTFRGSTGLTVAGKTQAEKNASPGLSVSAGLNANLSSRNGLTISPNVSLTAFTEKNNNRSSSFGFGASTSYNSRTGIKSLQLSEQMSISRYDAEDQSKKLSTNSIPVHSTSISFAKPSYIPSIRLPLTNTASAGHFQLGGGIFGFYGSVEAEVYSQKSEVDPKDVVQKKPLVGYLYYQNAKANPSAVMDFTRFNDGEVTSNTPIISAPQYSYDVFSIQGEGTGGSIRAYRNDLGYIRDNRTTSRDKNLSVGADVGIPGHFGANFTSIKTPSTIDEWGSGNKIRTATQFTDANEGKENVYFRSPGETSVLNDNQYTNIGGTDLVRYKVGGYDGAPTIEPSLERFNKSNQLQATLANLAVIQDRKKRTQVTNFLTAQETIDAGLEKEIRNYLPGLNPTTNNLQFDPLPRIDADHRSHHISQINVTEANGKRYIYGIPVYNLEQKDYTFSVSGTGDNADEVNIGSSEPTSLNTENGKDGYLQTTETPAYAHSFLLTGLLSSDYVDVNGDGITEDDLGGAVKFNYTRTGEHQWRTPIAANKANFNPGLLTEKKDDKGLITWGRRESWYVHSIESKTMVALFTLEDRRDGKGVSSYLGGVNSSENSVKRLKKIDLYSKADLKKNGLVKAKPVKTVWFEYDYSLCPQSRDNDGTMEAGNENKGKLTLKGIYFTFNGKDRLNKNKYVFAYGGTGKNAAYTVNASDRWGNYKPTTANPSDLKNSEYPYSLQDKSRKTEIDNNATSWSLNKVLLPSGGQIDVTYESDDYAFVQNRRAADMMEIVGLGKTPQSLSNNLYGHTGLGNIVENTVVAIKVAEPCTSRQEVFERYLKGQQQLAFKLLVNMPKGQEFVTSYAEVEDYNYYTDDPTKIWIKVKATDGISPLSLTAVEFLREQLPGQAFRGYDVSENSGLKQAGEMLIGMLDALSGAFSDPLSQLRSEGKAQSIILGKSFVRLNDPDGFKYGGGHRVKSVRLRDNWDRMTGQYGASYGQEYDYTTSETFNGLERTISSGVASYEPSIGGEENPFQTIVQVSNKLPLGPASYGSVQMPILDAFFPAPVVGYSKVSVRSLQRSIPSDKKSRSGIGKQVTEFYTAKDFPVYYNQTALDPASDKQLHQSEMGAFSHKFAFDSRALSQGFVVETNDMHGKLKSQSSYAENDLKTRINYTENFYRNTGSKGLDEKFSFVYQSKGGKIEDGSMGVDIELMTDTREFSTKSNSLEVQGQVDLFPVIFPFWLPFIWPVTGNTENTYRAVTTTKVISYHSILDSMVVIDKGSQLSTKNLVYDAETGNVVVSRTNNEFDQPIYNVNYPAYWAYSGMGLAYKNIDAVFGGVNFLDGKLTNSSAALGMIESGDELLIMDAGSPPVGCGTDFTSPTTVKTIWALDKNKDKDNIALTNPTPDFIFIDKSGNIYNRSGVKFRIIRSGKRNLLDASVAGFTALTDPRIQKGADFFLGIDANSKVTNASAMQFKEKWQTDESIIKKVSYVYDAVNCIYNEVPDCNGSLEKNINPYRKGLLGTFKSNKSFVFYNARQESDPLLPTNIKKHGALKDFSLYWDFNSPSNLVPNLADPKWVWNSEITAINSAGLELETKDALLVFTSAQYGYYKSLATAITNNARYAEAMNEGFEDESYSPALNAQDSGCRVKEIDFGIPVSSQQTGIQAHSGKFMLAVDNGTLSKDILIQQNLNSGFNLQFGQQTTTTLYDQGGNGNVTTANPSNLFTNPSNGSSTLEYFFGNLPNYPTAHVDIRAPANDAINGNFRQHNYQIAWNTYIKVTEKNTYSFAVSVGRYDYASHSPDPGNTNFNTTFIVLIKDANGTVVNYTPLATNSFNTQVINYNLSLCPGIYKVEGIITQYFSVLSSESALYSHFTWDSNVPSADYKSLSTANGCTYTTPIAGVNDMIHQKFSITPDKKMFFSAWVRQTTNAAAQVQFEFDGVSSSPLLPTGPIIEGWQRVEGEFTLPLTATSAKIKFINPGTQPIYLDDIRIHPFNANMKSYVYDPVSLRLTAELDANNYATFYEYDEEGTLVRVKAETKEGIKTIKETRSFQQTVVKTIQ